MNIRSRMNRSSDVEELGLRERLPRVNNFPAVYVILETMYSELVLTYK